MYTDVWMLWVDWASCIQTLSHIVTSSLKIFWSQVPRVATVWRSGAFLSLSLPCSYPCSLIADCWSWVLMTASFHPLKSHVCILVDSSGKLMDSSTETGTELAGTPAYCSPEVCRPMPADGHSDEAVRYGLKADVLFLFLGWFLFMHSWMNVSRCGVVAVLLCIWPQALVRSQISPSFRSSVHFCRGSDLMYRRHYHRRWGISLRLVWRGFFLHSFFSLLFLQSVL